jgi:capsular polysaccharide biosynthesis protein
MDVEKERKVRSQIPSVALSEGGYREINGLTLEDLWALIIRRKTLLFAFFLVATFAAIAWAWSLPAIYESRAVVQIGQLSRSVQPNATQSSVESTDDLVERLKEEYGVNDVVERQLPSVDSIKVNRGAKNIITITAHGYSPSETRDFLFGVTNKLLSDHDARVTRISRLLEGRMREVQLRLKETNNQIKTLQNGVASISKTNVAAAGILTMEQGILLQQVVALEKQGAELALDLNELNMRPTQIVREPTLQLESIRPKPLLYSLLGAILGLAFGAVIALFLELRSSRRSTRISSSD